MLEWEGRILDNKSIMAVKAALPFLDIPVGEAIDLEGLLRAVRCFCQEREQKLIDMLLNVFMMKRIFSMMNVVNEMNTAQEAESGGMEYMLDLLKSQMPKEQQEMFDMMSMMMSAAGASEGAFGDWFSGEEEPSAEPEMSEGPEMSEDPEISEPPIPDIWKSIAENSEKENFP